MNMVTTVGTAVGIAAAIVLIGHVLEWLLGARRERRLHLNVAATAVAAMATVGFLEETFLPDFPPSDGMLWLYWLAPPVAVVAIVNTVVRKPLVVWPLRILTAAGGIVLATSPLLAGAWEGSGFIRIGAGIVLTLLVWVGVDRLIERNDDDPSVAFGLAFAAAGGAGAIAFISSITLALAPAAIAMGTGATALLLLVNRTPTLRGIAEFYVPMLGIMYTMAHGYADFAAIPIVIVGVAPLLTWAGLIVAERSVWVRTAVRVIAVLVPVAIATPLAEKALSSSSDGGGQEVDEDGSYRPY